jgi:hypothetical protein
MEGQTHILKRQINFDQHRLIEPAHLHNGFHLLPKGIHESMDFIRGMFFWQGADEGAKYHMAKMDTVSRPKDQGGLGILNTSRMNECLLVKWIWKIVLDPMSYGTKSPKLNICLMATFSILSRGGLCSFGKVCIK